MNRIRVLVVLGFALAFAAGGSVGVLVRTDDTRQQKPRRAPGQRLAEELGLSSEQQQQMRKIWSEVMRGEAMGQLRQRRSELYRKRTEAFETLLTDQQREQYQQILDEHARQMEQIDRDRQRLIQQAVERTKAILTESQAKKYEEMRTERGHRRGPGGRPHGPFGPGGRGGAGTRPFPPGRPGAQPGRPGGPRDRHAPDRPGGVTDPQHP